MNSTGANGTAIGTRSGVALSVGVFLLAFILLGWNAAPSVSFHDSGEFSMAAACAGIPHPPGAPTWGVLASAFVRLGRFTDAARGANLFSAFCGAATIGLLFWIGHVWSGRVFPGLSRWVPRAAGLAGVAVLLHSSSYLEQSEVAEQYTLLTTLLLGLLAVATSIHVRAVDAPEMGKPDARRGSLSWCVLGVLWGLAIGNHLSQVSLVFWVAWVLCSAGRARPTRGDIVRRGLFLAAGLALGLLVFLWLPIRSHANPLLDWGNVKDLHQFIWAITRRQWTPRPISAAPEGFVSEWVATYGLVEQLGVLGLFLTVVGLGVLLSKGRDWFIWLGLGAIPYAAGLMVGHMKQNLIDVNYIRQYGLGDWHLPIYVAGALAAAVGFGGVVSLGVRYGRRCAIGVASLALLWLAVTARGEIAKASLRNFTAPAEFIRMLLAPLPADAIVLLGSDNLANMLCYQNWVTESEPGRWIVYDLSGLCSRLARAGATPRGWTRAMLSEYLTGPLMKPELQPLRVPPLSAERADRGRVFIEYRPSWAGAAKWLVPAGFLFEVLDHPASDDEVREAERTWRKQVPDAFRKPSSDSHRLEREARGLLHQWRGGYFAARGMWPEALDAYRASLDWLPRNGAIWFCLADAQDRLGRGKEAAESYERAIVEDPYLPGPRMDLAILLAQRGNLEAAEQLLLSELDVDPHSKEAEANLQLIRQQMGHRPASSR